MCETTLLDPGDKAKLRTGIADCRRTGNTKL